MRISRCTWKGLRKLAVGLALVLPLAACGSPVSPPAPAEKKVSSPPRPSRPRPAAPRKIQPASGFSTSATLAAGEVDVYTFPLEKGQLADLVIDQRGVDVTLTLRGPDGSVLTVVDSFSLDGSQGPELVPVTTEAGGLYRLTVQASDPAAPAGLYTVQFRALRPASRRDRVLSTAERAFAAGQALHKLGDGPSLRRAVGKHEEALAAFRTLGERGRMADVLWNLGALHKALGEPAAQLAAYREAAALFRTLGRRHETADALREIGIAQVALAATEEALESYREAIAMDRADGQRVAEAGALGDLARAYSLMGRWEQALAAYEQQIARWHELDQPGDEGYAWVNLGRIYAQLGEPQRAIDHFTRGQPLLEKAGLRVQAAGVLDDRGKALVRSGRTREGLAVLELSLRQQQRLGNETGEAVALNDLGATYESLGQKSAARRSYEAAVRILRKVDARMREAMVLSNLGRLQAEAGDLRGAAASYSRALQLSVGARNPVDQAAALLGLARIHRRLGDLASARQAAERSLALVEGLRVETVSPERRASFLATKQDHYELYVDLLMELHRREPAAGHDARAFEAGELARARSLLDTLAQARADLRRGIDPRLLARESALGDQINAAERRRLSLAESGAPRVALEAAERDLRELLARSERLRDRIRRSSPRYAALSQGHPASLRAIQAALDPDTLLLEYALGQERSYLWAVTSTSIASAVLPPRALIEKAARRALYGLGAGDGFGASFQSELPLAEVSHLLLDPVAGSLRKRLLIVGDGVLHTLPFAALPIPGHGHDGRPVPLIAEHEVLSLPSASALVALRRQPSARPRSAPTVAVLADPVFSASDPRLSRLRVAAVGLRGPDRFLPLPSSRDEAAAILALVPAARSFAALGFDGSRQTVLSGRLAPFQIVHFATHGILNSRYPELSGVELSRVDLRGRPVDGFLAVHDVYRLSLSADLVVLSGCDTGLGQEVRGEGLIGLTRAFFSAGAHRVLVSLWPVDDQATAELMRRFYREMLEHRLRPAAALQAAQNDLRREPRWEAPYSWAGFILQGDWR